MEKWGESVPGRPVGVWTGPPKGGGSSGTGAGRAYSRAVDPEPSPLVATRTDGEVRPAALVVYDPPEPKGWGVVAPALRRDIEAETERLLTDGRSRRYILTALSTSFGVAPIVVRTSIKRVLNAWAKTIDGHRDDLVREGIMRCRRRAMRADYVGDLAGGSANEKALQTWMGVAESRGITVNLNQNTSTVNNIGIVTGVSDDLLLAALTVLADPSRRGRGARTSPASLGDERVRNGSVPAVADAVGVPPGAGE